MQKRRKTEGNARFCLKTIENWWNPLENHRELWKMEEKHWKISENNWNIDENCWKNNEKARNPTPNQKINTKCPKKNANLIRAHIQPINGHFRKCHGQKWVYFPIKPGWSCMQKSTIHYRPWPCDPANVSDTIVMDIIVWWETYLGKGRYFIHIYIYIIYYIRVYEDPHMLGWLSIQEG